MSTVAMGNSESSGGGSGGTRGTLVSGPETSETGEGMESPVPAPPALNFRGFRTVPNPIILECCDYDVTGKNSPKRWRKG